MVQQLVLLGVRWLSINNVIPMKQLRILKDITLPVEVSQTKMFLFFSMGTWESFLVNLTKGGYLTRLCFCFELDKNP